MGTERSPKKTPKKPKNPKTQKQKENPKKNLNKTPKKSHDSSSSSLIVFVLDELYHDLLLRLDLQHLQREAHEGSGFAVPSERAAKVIQLHGLIHQRFGWGRGGGTGRGDFREVWKSGWACGKVMIAKKYKAPYGWAG